MPISPLFIIGFLLGVLFIKSEVASWFRIYEMFQFKSFHMYGIIGSAVVLGVLGTQFLKKRKSKDVYGKPIIIPSKEKRIVRYFVGGTIFGLGWALGGACPGPMYVLLGSGYISIIVLLLGALLGTVVYGIIKNKLPH